MMNKHNLLDFLFGESQEAQALEGLAEELGLVWETTGELKRDKTPLAKALKKLGLPDCVEEYPGGYLLKLNPDSYKEACLAIECPDTMHTLAELGWVAVLGGNQAMTSEPAECTVKFYELDEPESDCAEPQLDKGLTSSAGLEKTIRAAREFATEPMDRPKAKLPSGDGLGKATPGDKAKHAFHDSAEHLNPASVIEKLLKL